MFGIEGSSIYRPETFIGQIIGSHNLPELTRDLGNLAARVEYFVGHSGKARYEQL